MANTPNVRFKGFVDEWEECKLSEVANLTSSRRVHADDYVENGIPFYRGKEISELREHKQVSEVLYITEEKYGELSKLYGSPVKGDLLITAVGTIGNTWVVDQLPFYFKDGNLIWFKDIKCSPKYLDYVLSTPNGQKKIMDSAIGSNQKALTMVKLNELNFMFPESLEQEKIAIYFTNLDHLITLYQRKCNEVKQLKKFMLQKMFPKSGELIPEIRFAGFTDDWEQRKLSTIIKEKLANGVINKPGTEISNVKHINVIDMYTSDKIHTEDLASSLYDENTIQKCNVEVGDIFMTRSSLKPEGIAEANVLLDSGRYVFDDHLIRMKVDKSKYDPVFVKINLGNRMLKTQFIMRSKTTAFTTIGQEDISECEGMFPCFEEQKKIGQYFQRLDHLIILYQRKCDELKEVKRFMLQNMFPQKG